MSEWEAHGALVKHAPGCGSEVQTGLTKYKGPTLKVGSNIQQARVPDRIEGKKR